MIQCQDNVKPTSRAPKIGWAIRIASKRTW